MIRVIKDRVRLFGRCCLLLSDFRPHTVKEFYIPARPKGFTRRDYLRLRPIIEFASPSESQERGIEKGEKKEKKNREPWLNRDPNNTSIFAEGYLRNGKVKSRRGRLERN